MHSTLDPRPSTLVWPALERNTSLTAIPSVWRSLMGGGDEFETFQVAFLQKLPDHAKTVFCEKCYCAHEVIIYGPADHARALAEIGARPSRRGVPSPGGPRDAERLTLVGQLTGGGVGNALGQGEGGISSSRSPAHSLTHSQPALFAVCRCPDSHCPDIELAAANIEQWSLNWPRLARALCKAFSLNSQFTDLKLFNTHQIGTWSADAVPVILTIQPDRSRLRSTVCELSDRIRRPYILLAPTNANLDANIQETLARANAAFFPLDTNIVLTQNGTLHTLKAPGELFARFTPQPKECDEDIARRTMALIQQLDSDSRSKPPTVMTVFRLYCMEEFSAEEIATKCECSKATIIGRLNLIRQRTGVAPDKLRRFSPHLSKLEDEFTDSRAARIHRRRLFDDDAAGHESQD